MYFGDNKDKGITLLNRANGDLRIVTRAVNNLRLQNPGQRIEINMILDEIDRVMESAPSARQTPAPV
ncbi:MAG: hypothetical protein AB2827_14420 [Candidatus Thiodiazotropha sp.]